MCIGHVVAYHSTHVQPQESRFLFLVSAIISSTSSSRSSSRDGRGGGGSGGSSIAIVGAVILLTFVATVRCCCCCLPAHRHLPERNVVLLVTSTSIKATTAEARIVHDPHGGREPAVCLHHF